MRSSKYCRFIYAFWYPGGVEKPRLSAGWEKKSGVPRRVCHSFDRRVDDSIRSIDPVFLYCDELDERKERENDQSSRNWEKLEEFGERGLERRVVIGAQSASMIIEVVQLKRRQV